MLREALDRISGSGPPTTQAGAVPSPVPNGAIDAINLCLANLLDNLSELVGRPNSLA